MAHMARPCANTLPTAGCPDTLARWISTCSVAKPGSGTSTPTPNGTAVRPSPAPRPSVPSVDYEALATATIRGDYGNGQTRKAALSANYERVIQIVNRRLGVTSASASVPAPASVAKDVSVTVRSGDTMSGIATRTGLWPLSAWRVPSGNLNLIYPGNIVTYRGKAIAVSGSTAMGSRVHVVKSGETLSGIFGAVGRGK